MSVHKDKRTDGEHKKCSGKSKHSDRNQAETKTNRKVTECTELESQRRGEKRLGCFVSLSVYVLVHGSVAGGERRAGPWLSGATGASGQRALLAG